MSFDNDYFNVSYFYNIQNNILEEVNKNELFNFNSLLSQIYHHIKNEDNYVNTSIISIINVPKIENFNAKNLFEFLQKNKFNDEICKYILNIIACIIFLQDKDDAIQILSQILNELSSGNFNEFYLDIFNQEKEFFGILKNGDEIKPDFVKNAIEIAVNLFEFQKTKNIYYQFTGFKMACLLSNIIKFLPNNFEISISKNQQDFDFLNWILTDPFVIEAFSKVEEINIPKTSLPPFSLLWNTNVKIPIGLLPHYRKMFFTIANLLFIFGSKIQNPKELLIHSNQLFEIISESAAGRDAFHFILVYFLSTKIYQECADNFFSFIKSKTFSKAKTLCSLSFVFSFGTEIFPSTIELINMKKFEVITSIIQQICETFPDSPIKKKINIIKSYFGAKNEQFSIVEAAYFLSYQTLLKGCNSNTINHLYSLSKYINDPEIYYAFVQLTSLILYNLVDFSLAVTFCIKIISLLFQIGTNYPKWHPVNLWKERIFQIIAERINFSAIVTFLRSSIPPNMFIGCSYLIFHYNIQKQDFLIYCQKSYSFIPSLLFQLSLYEIPSIFSMTYECFPKFTNLTIQSFERFSQILIEISGIGYRPFMRAALTLFNNKEYLLFLTSNENILKNILNAFNNLLNNINDDNLYSTICFIIFWQRLASAKLPSICKEDILSLINNSAIKCAGEATNNEIASYFYFSLSPLIDLWGIDLILSLNLPKNQQFYKFIYSLPENISKKYLNENEPDKTFTNHENYRVTYDIFSLEKTFIREITGVAYHP